MLLFSFIEKNRFLYKFVFLFFEMTTNIDNEKEEQEEEEEEKKLEELEKEQREKEIEQTFFYYMEMAEKIHNLAVEIINEWINRNFKYEDNDIVLRKRAKIDKELATLIAKAYYYGIINYDNEKKKFIINTE